jgi:hypothetical protein
MAKTGRPNLPWGKNKSRDPNRRKITEMPKNILKGLTEEEKNKYRSDKHKEYLEKTKDDDKRLEYLKESPILLSRSTEPYDEFLKRVKKKNSDRLTEILNDSELMWRVFADRDDLTTKQKDVMMNKNKERKKYITNDEVAQLENYIYGSGKEPKWKDEEENEEYHNPYDEA